MDMLITPVSRWRSADELGDGERDAAELVDVTVARREDVAVVRHALAPPLAQLHLRLARHHHRLRLAVRPRVHRRRRVRQLLHRRLVPALATRPGVLVSYAYIALEVEEGRHRQTRRTDLSPQSSRHCCSCAVLFSRLSSS